MKLKKSKSAGVLLMLLLCGVLALSGCGEAASGNSGGGEGNGTADEEYGTRTFDNYGRTVTLEQMPQKVLTLGPNCSELFVALGLSDLIVGNSLDNHSRGPLPEYKEDYDKIPEMNYSSATREAVIGSGADFIYGIDWEFGGEALDLNEMEDCGITVYMNKASTLEEIWQEIRDLGTIFNVEDRAEAFIADQQAQIAQVQEANKGKEPVRVLVYDSGGEGVFTCGGNNFETELIQLAGGKNIFDDMTDKQWNTVSYEEILKRQPEVILIHDYDSPSLEEKKAAILSDPGLAALDCVKNQRFADITLESVLPGDRMAYGVKRMAEAFGEI